jgi:hypothetical protein
MSCQAIEQPFSNNLESYEFLSLIGEGAFSTVRWFLYSQQETILFFVCRITIPILFLNALMWVVMIVLNFLFPDSLGAWKSHKPNVCNQTNIKTFNCFIRQNQLCTQWERNHDKGSWTSAHRPTVCYISRSSFTL